MSSNHEGLTETILSSASFKLKKDFFLSGKTKSYNFRLEQLKKLKRTIKQMENEVLNAVRQDLHKPDFEGYVSELGLVYEEINLAVKKLRRWMKPKRVTTPLIHFHSVSKVYQEPLGVVLIISPWNYPFQLLLAPLIGAIAAGNCIILKPSRQTPHTAAIIAKVIENTFDSNYISVIQGKGSEIIPHLMDMYRFDHIFFSGSKPVGKNIGIAAAEKQTSCTLELGGKNPAIIDKNVNLKVAAKRLLWGKFFNAGQSCVAPDYLLIHEDIKDKFIDLAKVILTEFFGSNPCTSDSLAHIVNDKRMELLISYIKNENVVIGGAYDRKTRAIEPTIVDDVDINSPLMREEIFGPILPVITFRNRDEAVRIINSNPFPLALYIFTSDSRIEKYFIENIPFGGGCCNHTKIQFSNPCLPFGGIGYSGTGHYHGEFSFRTFSHYKSIIKSGTLFDLPQKYPPYTKSALWFISRFFK